MRICEGPGHTQGEDRGLARHAAAVASLTNPSAGPCTTGVVGPRTLDLGRQPTPTTTKALERRTRGGADAACLPEVRTETASPCLCTTSLTHMAILLTQ